MHFQKMNPPTPPDKFTDTMVFLEFIGGGGGTRVLENPKDIWKNWQYLRYELKTCVNAAKMDASFETWT